LKVQALKQLRITQYKMNVYRKLVISAFNVKDLLILQFYTAVWQPGRADWGNSHQWTLPCITTVL